MEKSSVFGFLNSLSFSKDTVACYKKIDMGLWNHTSSEGFRQVKQGVP